MGTLRLPSISDAVGAMQRRVVEFREQGFEKITEDVVDYVRTQPVNALLIAGRPWNGPWASSSGVRRR
jgi:hypothetical protein